MSITGWLARLARRRLDEDDLQDEIRAHLAIAADERMADGADRRRAELASRKAFGNLTLTREAARRVWTPRWIDAVHDQVNDVRYAIRALAKNPAFSLAVIGVLAIGIGLNAAVFTMLKSIAFSLIAGVADSGRLVAVFPETSAGREVGLSYPDSRHLRDHLEAFSGLTGSAVATVGLGRGKASRPIWAELVTGNYFEVLGVRAERGRTLLPSDEATPGGHPVVVISDGLWRRDFGADPDIVGRTVELSNYPLTIVGVADASFHGTTVVYDVEAFVPVVMGPALGFRFGSRERTASGVLADREASVFSLQGFLRSGATLADAAGEAGALWATRSRERPLTVPAERLRVVPFWQEPVGAPAQLLPTLTVLSAMGLLLLAIACANIAGLVLVRGLSRRGDIAVRLALGATRTRIVRLLIAENLVLALPGALLGVLLAQRAMPVLLGYVDGLVAPQRIFINVGVDHLVIGFAALVACGSALVFGFVPALRTSRVDLVSVINADASPRGAPRGRFRAGLVVAQVAVSLLLLVAAGLVTRSLDAARHANPGFDPAHVAALDVDVRQDGFDEPRGAVFYRKLLDAVRADPGVESATLAAYTPLAFLDTPARRMDVDGYEPRRGEDLAFMSNTVGPDYFRTLRIPLTAGREFQDRDDEAGARVAVVNDTFARRFWGGPANAVGRRIRVAGGAWRTVIGVAADLKYVRINEAPRPYVYLPLSQDYRAHVILHARALPTASGPATSSGTSPVDALVTRMREAVTALDANLPILYAKPMADTTRGALLLFNLMAAILFVFGIAGMALAGLGTYGLVSYVVRQSTHEIGIRLALGATGASVVRRFLGRGLRLGAIGAALGLVGALGLSRLIAGALFGVSPTDAASYLQALAIVLGGVAIATIVPAWRAARTNPLAALRHQ